MEINTTWQKITTVSGYGAFVQKHGLAYVQLAYATSSPTSEDILVLRGYTQVIFADTLVGQFIWARVLENTIELTVEEVNLNKELTGRVIITTVDDFPTVLSSTVQYFVDGVVDMGTRSLVVPAGGLHFAGYDLELSVLKSTESNYTLFTSPVGGSGNLLGANLAFSISGENSQVYNIVDATGFNAVEFASINYTNCTSLGTIDNYRQGLESGSGRFGGSPSLTLKGTWLGGFRITTSIVRGLDAGMTEPLFKAGTGFSMASRFLTDINCDLPASASLVDFASSHFTNPSTLQFKGCEITRSGVYNADDAGITPNIDEKSLSSSWSNNNGLSNTFEGGRLVVNAEATTTILAGSTWYTLNAATWRSNRLAHFSNPANGELLQLGNSPREYRVVVNFVIASAANNVLGIRLRKWVSKTSTWLDFPEVRRQVNNLSGSRDVAVFNYLFTASLDMGDYCYFQVRNNNGNNSCTLELDSDWSIEAR
tara:strand:- start:2193 stop:3638 length:1446 start_codon:yes stop_codon:yes gene_type:complete